MATSIAGYVARRRIIPAPELNQMRAATGMHMEEAKKEDVSRESENICSFLCRLQRLVSLSDP